ncbi:hypothetical protein Syun_012570 [Stephania yunnanensis]|uniref:Transposase-associated domain-containing protein n=1 Tax=Stephania yunnanensis TaxID=152371 RepID=A0AAP0PJ34_9MAGN
MYNRLDNGFFRIEFAAKVKEFISFAKQHCPTYQSERKIRCPCNYKKCRLVLYLDVETVEYHICRYGFVSRYHCWYEHGENGDEGPHNFYQMDNHIDDADVGGDDPTTYREMLHNVAGLLNHDNVVRNARLLAIKSEHHISERGYNEIIKFMKDCLPNDNSLVEIFYATKRLLAIKSEHHIPDQQQPPQIDPADPPQQGDNVEREAQECYIRLSEYEGVCPLCRGDVCEGTVCLEASSGGSFKPANLFLLLCNRKTSYLKGGFGVIGTISCYKAFSVRNDVQRSKFLAKALLIMIITMSNVVCLGVSKLITSLTAVKELLGSMDLMGIAQFGTWAYRGPCFNELKEITSLDASSYGYSHIGSLRKMFLRLFTVNVYGLDKTSIIKHLKERTSAPIKEVKSALVNCNWDIEAAYKDLRKRGAEAMFADLGHFFVRSIQIFTMHLPLQLFLVETRNAVELFDTIELERAQSERDRVVGITPDVQCTTDMLTSTRGLSSKDDKGTSSSLEADSCIMAKHQRRRQELTQTTHDQLLDDEAVYYKVAGDCPKGCVYSLRSLWRKKRRYVDPDASTS